MFGGILEDSLKPMYISSLLRYITSGKIQTNIYFILSLYQLSPFRYIGFSWVSEAARFRIKLVSDA